MVASGVESVWRISILSGKMDEVVDALVLYDQTQKLEELNK